MENILFCMKETWEHVPVHWQRMASWGGCQCWTGDPRILETPLATDSCSQRLNHSGMTHPSKTDWHQLSGITHWQQHRVDPEQERFSTGLSTPGTLIRIDIICMKETWEHVSVHIKPEMPESVSMPSYINMLGMVASSFIERILVIRMP